MNKKALFSSLSVHWGTPQEIYADLNREFCFDLDPCPLGGTDGLNISWAHRRVFCNPPYGPSIRSFLEKASESDVAVFLLPARTDTKWFHEILLRNAWEIRFLKGRLKFDNRSKGGRAPFPSLVAIFYRTETEMTELTWQ